MITGEIRKTFRYAVVAVAAMAGVLLAGQPVSAAPPPADRSCTVRTTWTCFTSPLWVGSGANPHIATLNVRHSAPPAPWPDGIRPHNSFVLVRNTSTGAELFRDYKYSGQHDIWGSGWPAGNYRAELHCPYGCQGANLYFDN